MNHVMSDIIEDRLPPRNGVSTPYFECEVEGVDDILLDSDDDQTPTTIRLLLTHRRLDAGNRGKMQTIVWRALRALREGLPDHAEDFSFSVGDAVKVGLFVQIPASITFQLYVRLTDLEEV